MEKNFIKVSISKKQKAFKMNATLPKELLDTEFGKGIGAMVGSAIMTTDERFETIEIDIKVDESAK